MIEFVLGPLTLAFWRMDVEVATQQMGGGDQQETGDG